MLNLKTSSKVNRIWSTLPVAFFAFSALSSSAQISTDGSLGAAIRFTDQDITIGEELGKRAGNNLFHSFNEFNINTGDSATFTGDAAIERVISRVTGGNISNIDGLLKSDIPNADFYFTNPAGFFFGPNAAINIDGSFHISTSDYLQFGDNDNFFSEPLENGFLSTESPTAFGFLDAAIGKITFERSDLNLSEREDFIVVGGDIKATDTTINVPTGEVGLISVASRGYIGIDTDKSGITSFNFGFSLGALEELVADFDSEISFDVEVRGPLLFLGNSSLILSFPSDLGGIVRTNTSDLEFSPLNSAFFTKFGDIFFDFDSEINVGDEGGGQIQILGSVNLRGALIYPRGNAFTLANSSLTGTINPELSALPGVLVSSPKGLSLSSCSTRYNKGQIGSFRVSPNAGYSLMIDDLLPSSSFIENGEGSGDELMMDEGELDGEFSVGMMGMDCPCVELGD